MLRRFPEIKINLTGSMLAYDVSQQPATPLVPMKKLAVLFQYAGIVAQPQYSHLDVFAAFYFFLALGIRPPSDFWQARSASFEMSTVRARLDESKFLKLVDAFRSHRSQELETCVACGAFGRRGSEDTSTYQRCMRCCFAT